MKRIPYSPSTFCIAPKNPSGGTANPPTPWIGSAIMHATSPLVPMSMTSCRSCTHAAVYEPSSRSLYGLRSRYPPCTKFTFRPEMLVGRHARLPVIAIALNERPW